MIAEIQKTIVEAKDEIRQRYRGNAKLTRFVLLVYLAVPLFRSSFESRSYRGGAQCL